MILGALLTLAMAKHRAVNGSSQMGGSGLCGTFGESVRHTKVQNRAV